MSLQVHLPVEPKLSDVIAHLSKEQIEGIYILRYAQYLNAKIDQKRNSLALGLRAKLFAEGAHIPGVRLAELQEHAVPLAESGLFNL